MKRAGAVVAALAMVVAALFARGSFTDDSDDPDRAGGDGDRSGLVCPTELADICGAATEDVDTAVAGATADALIEATNAETLSGEAWIVPAAWARLVLAERERLEKRAIFEIDDEPIASAPVMIAIWDDRARALDPTCQTPFGWRCLAEHAGEVLLDNPVRTGAPDVDAATGLTIAASQAAGLLGRSDFATNDFDDEFRALAAELARQQRDDPLRTMRSRGPGELTAAGTLELADRSLTSNFGAIVARTDEAVATRADIVALVPLGEGLAAGRRDALAAAFVEAGWGRPVSGPDGLPAGGVLAAIRTLWNDSR